MSVIVTDETNHALQNAEGWYRTIEDAVERLGHAQTCENSYEDYLEDNECCDGVTFDNEEAFDKYHDEDDARDDILNGPLSVEVRSGWASGPSQFEAEEFQILLTTGGPALRIMGELDEHNQPSRAWLEYQDWGTPWTQYFDASQETLVSYASNFYFGE